MIVVPGNTGEYYTGSPDIGVTTYDRNTQYGFGNHFKSGYGSVATLTFSFTVARGDDPLTPHAVRFRDAKSARSSIIEIDETGLRVNNSTQHVDIAPNSSADVVLVMNFVNKNATQSTLTLNTFVNGVSYGTYKMTYGCTVYTNTNSDIAILQFQHNQTSAVSYARATYLDNFRFYQGIDTEVIPSVENLSGASIRLDKNTDTSGLRFSFRIAKARYDELCSKGDVEVGALIVPTDYLTDGKIAALTHAAIGDAKALDMKVTGFSDESTDTYYYFNASIVKILSQNYAREFTAVGYVKVGDTYYYSHTSDSRSVIDVALKYGNSAEYAAADADKKAIADAYRSKVVYLELASGESGVTATVLAKEGYTAPYTVSYADGTLSLSGAGVSGISTIVLNGEVYTGGWSAVDGAEVEMVSAPYTLPAVEETPAE